MSNERDILGTVLSAIAAIGMIAMIPLTFVQAQADSDSIQDAIRSGRVCRTIETQSAKRVHHAREWFNLTNIAITK